MKYLCLLLVLPVVAQPPRRSVGASADGRGNTTAWVSSGITRAKGPLPGSPLRDGSAIVGNWTVGGGSSTQSYGQADLNSDTAGIGISLRDDGSYQNQYSAMLVMGAFVSATKVEEVGRWEAANGQLTFTPSRHDGWISVMSGKKQPVAATNPPPRAYDASTIAGQMVLRGRCLPYQVDPYCGTKSEGYAVLDFPMRRTTADSSRGR